MSIDRNNSAMVLNCRIITTNTALQPIYNVSRETNVYIPIAGIQTLFHDKHLILN
jgi:hypothetical protein